MRTKVVMLVLATLVILVAAVFFTVRQYGPGTMLAEADFVEGTTLGGSSDNNRSRALDETAQVSPPCAGSLCGTRDVSLVDFFSSPVGQNSAPSGDTDMPGVEEVLTQGLALVGTSPTHLAFRGTAQVDSTRCEWRGIARTVEQREAAVRFWLDLDDDEVLPSASEAERRFMEALNQSNPAYPATVRSNFLALARGGLSTEYLFLSCFVDYVAHEFLLGSGVTATTTLTVTYDRRGEARVYDLYRETHEAGEFGGQELMNEAEYLGWLGLLVSDTERVLSLIFEDRESVVFLAPMGAHHAIALEAWQAVAQWDIQVDAQGTVNAVRYGAPINDPEHTQTLPNLTSRIATATATATTTRLASVSGLNQYYRDIGAYSDITPGDNATTTFTPAQPPPVYAPAPATLTAAASGEETARLPWSSVSGGSGYQVQHRRSEAGESWTTATSTLTSTTYAVSGLRCGATHDFRVGAYGDGTTYNSRTGLWSQTTTTTDTCRPRPPQFESASYAFEVSVAARAGESVGTVTAFDLNDDPVTYSITAGNQSETFAIASSTGEITVAGGPGAAVGATYTLTVGASDGVSGTTSGTVTVTVVEVDCSVGAAIANPGSNLELVSDCETLLALRHALAGTATLNWSLDTPISSWDGVTVGGTPQRVPRLVLERRGLTGELPTELGLLTGLEELNVSLNSQLTGLIPAELGDLANLRTLHLRYNRLTGPIPPELGGLTKLTDLQLHGNALNGPIPPELGNLSELVNLYLGVNYLTGPIPVELSRLAQLEDLWLSLNRLSGPIPPELGMLQALRNLELDENRLSGSVPWELGSISSLSTLRLSGNSLEGCIRSSLRNVQTNDLDRLGLSDCPQTGRVPAPVGLGVSLASSTFTVTWGAVSGAGYYEVQERTDGPGGEWARVGATTATTLTYSLSGGPECGATFEFRVRSFGDATTYAAG